MEASLDASPCINRPIEVAELEAAFGARVSGLVAEVSDDKSLPKAALTQ